MAVLAILCKKTKISTWVILLLSLGYSLEYYKKGKSVPLKYIFDVISGNNWISTIESLAFSKY